jgi:hypothetical protein
MRVLSPQEKEWETALLNLTDNERRAIRESAQDRFNLIQSMRNGNQSYPLHGLGMVVRQMVVGNVEPTGETKKAVDKVAAARFNAEEQGIRRDSVKDEAAIYAEIPGVKDPLDQTFIRRGITTKDTRVTRVETSDELTAVLKGLAGLLIAGKGK